MLGAWFFSSALFGCESISANAVSHCKRNTPPVIHAGSAHVFQTTWVPDPWKKNHQKSRILRRLMRHVAPPSLWADDVLGSSSVKWTVSWICMTTRISISVNQRDNLDKLTRQRKPNHRRTHGGKTESVRFVLRLYRSTLAAVNLRLSLKKLTLIGQNVSLCSHQYHATVYGIYTVCVPHACRWQGAWMFSITLTRVEHIWGALYGLHIWRLLIRNKCVPYRLRDLLFREHIMYCFW